MRYYSTIISLFSLSVLAIISLLYFGNITRNIEKENYTLEEKIRNIENQININEIEFSLYNNYEYLQKMQKIYLNSSDEINLNNRISYYDLKNKNIENFYTIGTN